MDLLDCKTVKLRLVSEQCQAVLGHGIVLCLAASHLPPMRVIPPRVQRGWGSVWAPTGSELPWVPMARVQHLGYVSTSISWLSCDHVALEEASFVLDHGPWGWLHLDAVLCSGPGLRSIRALLGVLWEKMGGAAWADPACPAVHCSNCGCLSPFCAWLDCSTQDFRLTSYGNEAESCSLCQSICHFAWKEEALHLHRKANFS